LIQTSPPGQDSSSSNNAGGKTKVTSACPQCGQHRLVPVARRWADRLIGLFVSVRRFRCRNMECRWEGNLVKSRMLRRTVGQVPKMEKQIDWLMLGGIAFMVLTVVIIIAALLIGWLDGSLEGYEGLLNRRAE